MTHIAVLAGDGIGREVVPEALRVVEAVGVHAEYTHLPHSADHTLKTGETIADETLRGLAKYDAIFVGAFGDPRIQDNRHAKDILLGMRFKLDLYVNFRPSFALSDAVVPLTGKSAKDVQFVVFRENTEGLYTGIGGTFKQGTDDEVAVEQEVNTRKGVERILREAFRYAADKGLSKVVMADKANAMTHGHGLWRRCFELVRKDYPAIKAQALYVDNLVFQLVRDPAQFQVIVTNNLFGDIVTDLAAALHGGLGVATSANYHPGGPRMFEPVHGSAPDIAGKGLANPLGAIGSAALMLSHLGFTAEAARIDAALAAVMNGKVLPRDLGGDAPTRAVADAVVAAL